MQNKKLLNQLKELEKKIDAMPNDKLARLIDSSNLIPGEYDKMVESLICEGHVIVSVDWSEGMDEVKYDII